MLEQATANKEYGFVETLQERNRGLILLLLDKIGASGKGVSNDSQSLERSYPRSDRHQK
jgi:hypothetical protein